MNIYIWKGKKIQIGNDFAQEEFNLLEASKEQLEGCLRHCDTMLNNTDKYQPGRYVLCDLIKEQIVKCHVEMNLINVFLHVYLVPAHAHACYLH